MFRKPSLNIVLYQPEIPHNTGSVGRTCVAVGAKLWLVRPLGFAVDDAHLRRAGLDYWRYLDWEVVDDWETLVDRLPRWRVWYFSRHATLSYTGVTYRSGDILVFGCESQGLPRRFLRDNPARSLRIPVAPRVRSLNLSSSVAVVAYEALRQWQPHAAAGAP